MDRILKLADKVRRLAIAKYINRVGAGRCWQGIVEATLIKRAMMKTFIILALAAVLLGAACSRTTTPVFIESLTTQSQSDGLGVFFRLADKDGNLTRGSGTANLRIIEEFWGLELLENGSNDKALLLDSTLQVRARDFKKATNGSIQYNLGHFRTSEFRVKSRTARVRVELTFVSDDGKTMQAHTLAVLP